MTQETRRYPIGIQSFEKIIEGNYIYADKTDLLYKLTKQYEFIFLSRPRRFGKSLLTSTFKNYFSGKKELFYGLKIENLEKEWNSYPVVHLSFASVKSITVDGISQSIDSAISRAEHELTVEPGQPGRHNSRIENLIRQTYDKTGRQVVVLIDEYDAPILNVLHDEEKMEAVRQMMREVYSPLKDCDSMLRFVFITGITKFAQLSIFSELNNIKNISMLPEYSTICGITQDELETTMSNGVNDLAAANEWSRAETLTRLKSHYDGYRFSYGGESVYNPFSLLNALSDRRINEYWFGTGTPTFLTEMVRKYDVDITEIDGSRATADNFDAPTAGLDDIIPLFYQSGYLTIKEYDNELDDYVLGYPNSEVRIGMMKSFFPYYVKPRTSAGVTTNIIARPLLHDDIEGALAALQQFLKSVPYQENTRHLEGHYTMMLYVIFSLLGMRVQSQVRTSDGRIDILLTTKSRNYVMELKIDSTAQTALDQIESKDYALAVTNTLPVTKVGLNFSTVTGTLTDWIIR